MHDITVFFQKIKDILKKANLSAEVVDIYIESLLTKTGNDFAVILMEQAHSKNVFSDEEVTAIEKKDSLFELTKTLLSENSVQKEFQNYFTQSFLPELYIDLEDTLKNHPDKEKLLLEIRQLIDELM